MGCVFLLLILAISGFEALQNYSLINETKEISKEYDNFLSHSTYEDDGGNRLNGEENYPYRVIKDKYLCVPFEGQLTIEEQLEQNSPSAFNDAHQIMKDLAFHSMKWVNFYLCSFWGLWLTQAGAIIAIIGSLVYAASEGVNDEELCTMVMVYSTFLTFKLHLFLTTAYLQSLFLVLNFDDICIFSLNPDQVHIVYTLKNWGIIMFILGFLLIFIYLGHLVIQFTGPIEYLREQYTHFKIFPNILALFSEIIVIGELLFRLRYFYIFMEEFEENANESMGYLILQVFLLREFIICVLYLIVPITACKRTNWYMCRNSCRNWCRNWCRNCIRHRERAPTAPRNSVVPEVIILPDAVGVEKIDISLDVGSVMFCTICLDTLQPGTNVIRVAKCNHLFHRLCINQWVTKNNSCPMCRGNL